MRTSFLFVKNLRSFDETINATTRENYLNLLSDVQERVKYMGKKIKSSIKEIKLQKKGTTQNLDRIDYDKLSKRMKMF